MPMASTTTSEVRREGLAPNSDNGTFDFAVALSEKKFQLKHINEEQDSDDSQEEPDFDTPHLIMHASGNGRELTAMDNQNIKVLEESVQNMPGDIYQSTVKTATINQLTIGPTVENVSRRTRRASMTSNGNARRNSELEPNYTNENNTTSKGTAEEEHQYDRSVSYSEDEESVTTPNNFDTKVNITMPNEGPPKIEVQITNQYHGPIFHLDAEATKEILSRDHNIIAQIYARETSAMPNIIVSQPKTEMRNGGEMGNTVGDSVINMEGNEHTTNRPQHVDFLRRSSRKRKRDPPVSKILDVLA